MAQIGIIDYGCGNIRSVAQAFEYLGHSVSIYLDSDQVSEAEHLVLPGVGAFEKAASSLKSSGFDAAICTHIQKGNPFLGICVGMQVLMDKGYEFGEHDGLGLISGETKALVDIEENMQSPHIGWAPVQFKEESHFYQYDLDGQYFYFNHSYACIPGQVNVMQATIGNKASWPVLIEKDNIIGIQCHPEKSHVAGLQFLTAFANMK